jgi:hypothetical protein
MKYETQAGVSLLELMIALVLGLLVALGVVSLFIGVSKAQLVHTQIARIQEEGRMAIAQLAEDLRMANAQHCSNTGGNACDVSPALLSMRGYDCGLHRCMPSAPIAMGAAVGDRVPATDMLTLRFIDAGKVLRTIGYRALWSEDKEAPEAPPFAALTRCDHGDCAEIARGIERLDFRYVVEGVDGDTHYLGAAAVDSRADGMLTCPDPSQTETGCLWGAIKAIEVNLLIDGQLALYTLTQPELAFAYATDGIDRPRPPDRRGAAGIAPADQGFTWPVLRRQFNATFSVRNFNP